MNGPTQAVRGESRWPPALVILGVVLVLAALPGRVYMLPVWVSYLAALAILVTMAAVALTQGDPRWLRLERAMILLVVVVYMASTLAELADLVGLVTLHPSEGNAFSLLSSSAAIWAGNVLIFSLLYWQIDRGGPYARASGSSGKPDWVFPQPATPEDLPPDWRPVFLDYLYLGYNTATAFSPTDVLPLTHRAKLLMMLESMISLVTMVVVVSRAINVLPS